MGSDSRPLLDTTRTREGISRGNGGGSGGGWPGGGREFILLQAVWQVFEFRPIIDDRMNHGIYIYEKFADFSPVLTSGFTVHLKSKFRGTFLLEKKRKGVSTNPYNSKALGFGKWWKLDMGRDGGGGHPGTADMNSKLIVAFIARKCTPWNCHWSFTDVGCAEVSVQCTSLLHST